MKRALIIIAGIVLILTLIGVWVYVLVNGSRDNTPDQFNELNFGDTTDTNFVPSTPEPKNDEPVVDVSGSAALRQLTTKPVIGYTEVRTSSTSVPYTYYVEAGTGHIFSINLETGEEKRVSATTIPLARRAAITPDGQHVLVQAGEGAGATFVVGTINSNSTQLGNSELRAPIVSFAATADGQFIYAIPNRNGLVAQALDPDTGVTRTLFNTPFREATIRWHHTVAGPHTVYPTANSRLEGMVYTVTDGALKRAPLSGYGLSAVGSSESIIMTNVTSDNGYQTTGYDQINNTVLATPVAVIPEKCAFSPINPTQAVCGADLTTYPTHMPTDWYQGTFSPNDGLWEISPNTGVASPIVLNQEGTRQKIDIEHPLFGTTGERFYFSNKIDNTLWVYDFTK